MNISWMRAMTAGLVLVGAAVRAGAPTAAEAQGLLREAGELLKAKRYDEAVARLRHCVAIAPAFAECHKKLGSTYAKIASRDSSSSDMEQGLAEYERYLELAPADDPDRPKVRQIVDAARGAMDGAKRR